MELLGRGTDWTFPPDCLSPVERATAAAPAARGGPALVPAAGR